MKAWVLHGPRDLRLEDRTRPSAAEGYVVIRVSRAGICGTDVHYYQEGRNGTFVVRMPFVIGHEFAGTVVETGRGAGGLSIGDRVAVDPTIPCLICAQCRQGRSNLCADIRVFGSASAMPHLDGGFQEYVAVPVRCCHRLPESVDDAAGALMEPLAVAAHALQRAGGVSGLRILITGAGAVGQCVLTFARAMGASRIGVSDPDPFARSFALQHGADVAVDPSLPDAGARLAEYVPGGFDKGFEASGSLAALRLSVEACCRGATIVQIGNLPAEGSLPANLVVSRELAFLGSLRYANLFEKVLDLIQGGRVSVGHLVTHVVPLSELPSGLELATRRGNVIKVQVGAAGG